MSRRNGRMECVWGESVRGSTGQVRKRFQRHSTRLCEYISKPLGGGIQQRSPKKMDPLKINFFSLASFPSQLPWKTLKNIIEYYYMWKTTDRYVQQKRLKAADAESKLKQVYIPNYTKPNPAIINNTSKGIMNGSSNGNGNEIATINGGKPCESCSGITSTQVMFYAVRPFGHSINFFISFNSHSGTLGVQRIWIVASVIHVGRTGKSMEALKQHHD